MAGCAHSEPKLGVGPNPLKYFVRYPSREMTFGDFPMCNKSPSDTKIVITGIRLQDPTSGMALDGWGWSDSFGKPNGLVTYSKESLSHLGFVTKPVEVKMDCQGAIDSGGGLPANVSPQFALRIRASGTGDEWTKNGITVSFEQNGTPMEATFGYVYAFCASHPPHDNALLPACG